MESTARKPGPTSDRPTPTRFRPVLVPARPYVVPGRPNGGSSSAARPASLTGSPVRRHLPPPPPPGPIARVVASPLGTIPVRGGREPVPVPVARPSLPLPHLRRNVCPHFYMTGARGAIPVQAPHLLKALMRQESTVSRCQLRGGVHLDQGYVADICLSPRFNQCVFYEDELTRS